MMSGEMSGLSSRNSRTSAILSKIVFQCSGPTYPAWPSVDRMRPLLWSGTMWVVDFVVAELCELRSLVGEPLMAERSELYGGV